MGYGYGKPVQQSDIENICFIASRINVIYFLLCSMRKVLLSDTTENILYNGYNCYIGQCTSGE